MRSAMPAASQLPGRGPADVDVAPVHEIFSLVILSLLLIQEGQLLFLAKECAYYWLAA